MRPFRRIVAFAIGSIAAAETSQLVLSHTQVSSRTRALETSADLCDGVQGFSGYVDTVDDRHIYYWAFPSANEPSTDPVILWLSGGPGASSVTFGALSELGACIYDSTAGKPKANPYSWHTNATVIFVDQPVNVGYSYSPHHVSTLNQSTADLYAFIANFMHDLPQYSHQPFYVAGESYGGSYVPGIANKIHEKNKEISAQAPRAGAAGQMINLQGVLIGNGLFQTAVQRPGFVDLGCTPGIVGPMPLLNDTLCQEMRDSWPRCKALMARCALGHYKDRDICRESDEYCVAHFASMINRIGRNPYDIRERCVPESDGGEMCMHPTTLFSWLDRADVRAGLNVDAGVVYRHLSYEMEEPLRQMGKLDIRPTFWLRWEGTGAFRKLPFEKLYLAAGNEHGQSWGYHKRYRQLSFFEIAGAGHMAPADKPAETLEMVQRWMAGEL
ncbi:hypothetical protein ABOM_003342 [Aspergillus bombycis]|uniref:Carboxypeptidase n=1 Tax=Aspergillus bombycis TaxID=109264 RepID=A0A1F8A7X8_9EURO|nr:hypothetical protein ABOM_003342 [Aspergillus bombycis]OGM47807.1 hypothetical protein ABOM_003342 [Aspergillus bombycis]